VLGTALPKVLYQSDGGTEGLHPRFLPAPSSGGLSRLLPASAAASVEKVGLLYDPACLTCHLFPNTGRNSDIYDVPERLYQAIVAFDSLVSS